jgi:hypothetical protein
MRNASVAAICALALGAASAARAEPASPLYQTGKQDWLAALYPEAYDPLFAFRGQPYGRTAEVDYMLGTSACRISGKRAWGANVLNYIQYAYPLTTQSRRQVAAEYGLCRGSGALAPVANATGLQSGRLVAAGATARGKLYYMPGPSGQPAAAYPAFRVHEIPPADLLAREVALGQPERAAAALAAALPAGARTKVIGRFAFVAAAGQSDAELARLADVLEAYVRFLQRTYGLKPPDRYVTLYLLPDIAAVQTVALKAHGLNVSPSTLGYAYPDDLSVVATIQGAEAGTLLHELFHLLVRQSFGDVPQWLDEGVASLYEVSARQGDTFRGQPNWRGRVLADFRSEAPKLDALVASPWFGFDRADPGDPQNWSREDSAQIVGAYLATARYFALFLQERGRLNSVYQAFRSRDPGEAADPGLQSVRLVERALGKPIEGVQAEYEAWLPHVLGDDASTPPSRGPDRFPNAAPRNADDYARTLNAIDNGPLNAANIAPNAAPPNAAQSKAPLNASKAPPER